LSQLSGSFPDRSGETPPLVRRIPELFRNSPD